MSQTQSPPAYRCEPDRIVQNVPACLRERPQWVCWRWKWARKKYTKVPVNPLTGNEADSTDSSTWGSFEQALAGLKKWHRIAGIGFVFSADDPYCGVDLDKCIDPETKLLKPWAVEILQRFDSYCEISPSGNGLKIFIAASKPGPRCKTAYQDGDVEMYDHDRFFTTTGIRIVRCLDGGRIQTG